MPEIRIVRDYPHSRAKVWRALTDPALVPLWTSTGQGGRPEGFKPEVGTKFRFIGKPFPGWDGIVRCEVLAVDEPRLLRYDWRNKESDEPAVVTNRLEEVPGGTRLTWGPQARLPENEGFAAPAGPGARSRAAAPGGQHLAWRPGRLISPRWRDKR